jgi:hypothetical protein
MQARGIAPWGTYIGACIDGRTVESMTSGTAVARRRADHVTDVVMYGVIANASNPTFGVLEERRVFDDNASDGSDDGVEMGPWEAQHLRRERQMRMVVSSDNMREITANGVRAELGRSVFFSGERGRVKGGTISWSVWPPGSRRERFRATDGPDEEASSGPLSGDQGGVVVHGGSGRGHASLGGGSRVRL